MAWPKNPHFKKPKPKAADELIQAVRDAKPGSSRERDLVAAARRADRDYVVGTIVEATTQALDDGKLDTAIRGASEIGRILGLYIERHQSQSEIMYRIPALEAMSLEELRALAQLPDAPQPHHEAAPVLPDAVPVADTVTDAG